MIEVVVVDLGGVAARFWPERRLAALASLSGLAPEVIQQHLFDSGLEHRAELGELAPEELLREVQSALDGGVSAEALVEAWALAFEVDTEVLGCIDALDARTALFTNNGPMLDACLVGPLGRLKQSFAAIVCSWHLKARKPDADAFERAAERLGCTPGQLLLLDDSEANVRAAIRCGWQAEQVVDAAGVRAAIKQWL